MKRAALALVVFLAGCAHVNAGEVVDKEYYPLTSGVITTLCGKSICTTTQIYPEHWELWVCEGEDMDPDRKCEWWSVSRERYDATEIGDRVTKDPA